MVNRYSNDVVQDLVWAEIADSACAQDFLDFLGQFPDLSSPFWAQALDRAVATFSPDDPSGAAHVRRYPRAFQALEQLLHTAPSDLVKACAAFHLGKMLQQGYGTTADRDQSINLYKKAIGLGEIRALINCGAHYEGPDATPEDLAFADQLYAQALAKGEPMGLVRQAERFQDRDDPRRISLYLQAAEHGMPYGLHRVGAAHYFGTGGQREDESLGVSWMQRAGRAGSLESCRILGWHYERDDHGRAPDPALSLEWQRLGATLGDAACMRALGYKCLLGIECETDKAQANYWLHRAAVLGDDKAQYRMGQLWITSENPDHRPWGLAWLRLAADNGNDYAAWRTALAFRDGVGCTEDKAQSFKYCRIAAKGGYPEAQGQLGLYYWHGNAVERNLDEAYKWIHLCALQGQALGQYLLGVMTLQGMGCTADPPEAMRLFHAAADKGELQAMHEIGDCYYFGHGVDKDVAMSAVWYGRAAHQGHAAAMTDLGYLLKEGEGVLSNPEEAFHWFSKAIELGDARAMYMLAFLYANGEGVEHSPEMCRRWMSRAAMLNYKPAKDWIDQNLPKAPQWLEQISGIPYVIPSPDPTDSPND